MYTSRDRTHRGKVIPVGLQQRRELGDGIPLIVDDVPLLVRSLFVVDPIAIVTTCVLRNVVRTDRPIFFVHGARIIYTAGMLWYCEITGGQRARGGSIMKMNESGKLPSDAGGEKLHDTMTLLYGRTTFGSVIVLALFFMPPKSIDALNKMNECCCF